MKKYIFIIILLLAIGGVLIYKNKPVEVIELDLPPEQKFEDFQVLDEVIEEDVVLEEDKLVVNEKPEVTNLKIANINLNIPFTSQAPTGNWDQPFQDACEEASILMVDYYYANKAMPSPEEVETILVDIVKWQEDNWGGHFNLPVSEAALLAKTTFGYETEVITDLSVEKIKEFLNKGIPVIVPADGHKLDNPFFSGDGPEYHMLVIKGYVDDNFITNDPGTRRGADFIYSSVNLMESIADWDKQKSRTLGPKTGLVLYNN